MVRLGVSSYELDRSGVPVVSRPPRLSMAVPSMVEYARGHSTVLSHIMKDTFASLAFRKSTVISTNWDVSHQF